MPRHGSAAPVAEVDNVQDIPRRSSMAGWSIRRKLGALVTIPLVVLLVGGGLLVASLGVQYKHTRQARDYANAIPPILATSSALNSEFTANSSDRDRLRAATDARVAAATPVLKSLSQGDDDTTTGAAGQVLTRLQGLKNVRTLIDSAAPSDQIRSSETGVSDALTNLIGDVTSELTTTTSNREISSSATIVSTMNVAQQAATAERTDLDGVLADPSSMSSTVLNNLDQAQVSQQLAINQAKAVADPAQLTALTALANAEGSLAPARQDAENLLQNKNSPVGSQASWDATADARIAQMAAIADQAADTTQSTARRAETSALLRVAAVAAAVLLTIVLVTALLAAIARTVTGPLRRLRAGAVDVASVQLPAAVARIEQDGVAADVSLPPVLPADSNAGPETLEVARAVDDLGAEAVRLATAQVRLRRALDEAFVSMSRRSQSMVEKQLAIIDELESQEQDPDQLRNLFRLDHLAARMRRYNDNLLVLAGSAVRTRATAPVKVAELFRAATSEMEQYERVRLQPVSGASIAGTVAGELVHLLAELLDNAAMYSPPSSPIVLSAAFTADGGLQIEVLDAGVGISPGELDRLNARLTQPESIDTQVPSRMGLFVVARLARRGTFGVMLQTRPDAAGTVALVRIPANLVIGAPGSTGEAPQLPPNVALRPATPAVGINGQQLPGRNSPYAAFESAAPTTVGMAPAAAAAGAAAAAAARVRSVAEPGEDLSGLPRRRRAPAASGSFAGLPPEAQAAAANPATGLFAPNTPPAASGPDDELPTRSPAAGRPSGGLGTPDETSPTGFPSLRMPMRNPLDPQQLPYDQRPPQADQLFGETPASGLTGLPSRPSSLERADPLTGPMPETDPTGSNGRSALNGMPGGSTGGSIGGRQNGMPHGIGGPNGLVPEQPAHPDPLTAATGEFRAPPNLGLPTTSMPTVPGNGQPEVWDDDLPTELAARAAAAASYRPSDPSAPMIGDDFTPDFNDPTPIFDQISVWFTSDLTGSIPVAEGESEQDEQGRVIDVRTAEERRPSSRWASLGDQRWLATNARAAAAPETEGATEIGLPKRRPGANLLPSAATAAPTQMPARTAPSAEAEDAGQQADADQIRGRLGSYQRGLADARRARTQPAPEPTFDPVGASLFTANSEAGEENAGEEQGGDQ